MRLFKRREYSLELADGTLRHAFQAPSPKAALVKAKTLAAEQEIPQWKLRQDPSATYSCSLRHQNNRHLVDTHFTDLVNARKFEIQYRRSLAEGRLADLKRINLRQPVSELTVGTLLPHWRGFAASRGITEAARRGYENALRVIWQRSTGKQDGFEALEKERAANRNRYIAVWLAVGFGLRKSEIAAVKAGWFLRQGGTVRLELRGTVVPGQVSKEKSTTKNGTTWPCIDVSNGAWEKLEPIIAGLQPDEYVIQCPTATERVEGIFRRVSSWMRDLGWGTQKTIHEFRAFGGCQVAMRDGIEAASRWLRHSSIVVTQKHYGRYLRPKITNAPIELPKSVGFTPQIVRTQG